MVPSLPRSFATGLIAMLILLMAVPAATLADEIPVSVAIAPGDLSLALVGASVDATGSTASRGPATSDVVVRYGGDEQRATVSIPFLVDDARLAGVPAGWQVVVEAGDLSGPGGAIIPASRVSGQVGVVTLVAGDPSLPDVPAATGIGQPAAVLVAPAGTGAGRYEARLDLTIAIPAYARPGTYSGQVVITIVSAP
jgi:hypothetical protein